MVRIDASQWFVLPHAPRARIVDGIRKLISRKISSIPRSDGYDNRERPIKIVSERPIRPRGGLLLLPLALTRHMFIALSMLFWPVCLHICEL